MAIQEFNAVTGRALVRALQSLESSTSLTVIVRGAQYSAEGLCSPYRAHQQVNISHAPVGAPTGVVLQNGRFVLYAALRGYDEFRTLQVPRGHEGREAIVPISAITGACRRLTEIVPGLAEELRVALGKAPFVNIGIHIPTIVGYTGGKPVFYPDPDPNHDAIDDDPLAGITEASFSPDDDPPVPDDEVSQ